MKNFRSRVRRNRKNLQSQFDGAQVPYGPKIPYNHSLDNERRIVSMIQMKDIILTFSDSMNGFWLKSSRDKHPNDVWLHQDRKYYGSIFPTGYAVRERKHPRLGITFCNTVQNANKSFRNEI